jgi:hypothetical protein
MKTEVKTIRHYLDLQDNRIYCYTIKSEGFEVAKYWSIYGEDRMEFLTRIAEDVERIVKMLSK